MRNGRWRDVLRMKMGRVALIGFCFIALGMAFGGPGHGLAFTEDGSRQPERVAAAAQAPVAATAAQDEEQIKEQILEAYGRLPLAFVRNEGQINQQVHYYGQGRGSKVYFTSKEVRFTFVKPAARHDRAPALTPVALREKGRGTALSLEFLGANPKVRVAGRFEQAGKVNYFVGNNPASWRTDLSTYREVVYKELWPGVEAAFRDEAGRLKYEFHLQPGTKVEAVRLAYNGAEGLSLDDEGNILIKTPSGVLSDVRPTSYQVIDGRKVPVQSRFVLKPGEDGKNAFGFAVAGYDPAHPLVIDPGLIYSTYVGGLGPDDGYGIRVDASGNAYVTGITERDDFPVTGGTFDKRYNGSIDAFVLKLNPTGSDLLFSTYLGGSSLDYGEAIALDASGNPYVAVSTSSADMPVTAGAYQTARRGSGDAYVAKLSADGSDLLIGTYFGGSGGESVKGIALDGSGNVYLAGNTSSVDLPASRAFDSTFNGGSSDAYVARLNSALSLLRYSTYLGGSGNDYASGLAVRGADAYVTGNTSSTDFPTTAGAFDASANGNIDPFVARVYTDYASVFSLIYSTYLGGSNFDYGRGIGVDTGGNAYVAGYTQSLDFPTTPGAFDTSANGGIDVFVSKLTPTGSGLAYSTFLGGVADDTGFAITVDASGNAYVTGATDSSDYPVTPDTAFSATKSVSDDIFLSKLDPSGAGLLYSTFLGGNWADRAFALDLDAQGNVYLTGHTGSSDFPTTPDAFDPTYNDAADVIVAKLFPLAPGPDLVVSSVTGPTSARRGDTVSGDVTVQNRGTTATGAGFAVAVYLSTDNVITSSDTPLATVSASALDAGASQTIPWSGQVPTTIAKGTYYLGAITDSTNVIAEGNEDNNAAAGNTISIR